MKVSFIIPLYKGEKYIAQLQKMISENTALFDEGEIEIIFINDYPDEKIVVDNAVLINNPQNLGIHESRVRGLEKATGDIVIFLDQDDFIAPNYVSSQIKKLGEKDAIVCNGKDGEEIIYQNNPNLTVGKFAKKDCILSPGQVCIRKKAIPSKWLNNIMKSNGADDYFLWLLFLLDKKNFVYNNEVLFTHQLHSENTSSQYDQMGASLKEMGVLLKRMYPQEFDDWRLQDMIDSHIKYLKIKQVMEEINTDQIDEYCKKNDIKTLAMWGIGKVGKRFRKKIPSSIKVIYIDSNVAADSDGKTYALNEDLADLFIVSAPLFEQEILKEAYNDEIFNIISLLDFISGVSRVSIISSNVI